MGKAQSGASLRGKKVLIILLATKMKARAALSAVGQGEGVESLLTVTPGLSKRYVY